ncbi:hypothetical protein [Pedobacter sp. ASV28]|uniref:hypothetical protein n=1 Tax=Pedobacter sp. ASV28 TaxID=2795123 RepID=UPI0018EC98EE|nr:hypothetical protein [Pedobacter sp. ASV28]
MRISYIFIFFLFAGCITRQSKDRFRNTSFCFAPDRSNVVKSVNINGYYQFEYTYEYDTRNTTKGEWEHKVSRYNLQVVFYPDGLFFGESLDIKKGLGVWGSYYVQKDTIYVQYLNPPGSLTDGLTNEYYKIVDENMLEFLKIGSRSKEAAQISQGKFISFGPLPDPNKSWLKNKSWFWCNREEFKKWKAGQKEN